MGSNRMFRRFLRDDRGNGIVEGVIVLPLLLMAWVGAFAFWEAFNARAAMQKATYVAADILSREMVAVDDAFLEGLDTTVDYLVDDRFDVSTRFTSFERTGPGNEQVTVLWSRSSAQTWTPMADADLVAMADQLPVLSQGNTAVIVETRMGYSLPFKVPIASYVVPATFNKKVVLMPRYLPRICHSAVAC